MLPNKFTIRILDNLPYEEFYKYYGSEKPNDLAIERAAKALEYISPIEFNIGASCENGVCLSYHGKNQYYSDIEFYNDGDINAINSKRDSNPDVWSVDPENINSSLDKILEFQGLKNADH